MYSCPNCHFPLEQIGHVAGPPEWRVWVGENLYRCRDCPCGSNRFSVDSTGRLEVIKC